MKKIHIIGIGGIAMSAIAQYFIESGFEVTGSDLNQNELITELREKGATIELGHQPENIKKDIDKVIYSDAIPEDNVEILEAKNYNIELLGRSQALALITEHKKVISATGTHGKTTTSALIAQLLEEGNKKPSFVIGGIVNNFNSNFKINQGEYFVLEGDEYGKSFLKYPSDIGVVSNIEFDHPDIYQDMDEMLESYAQYINNLNEYLVTNQGVIEQLSLDEKSLGIEIVTVGINDEKATFNATEIKEEELNSYFTLKYLGQRIDRFKLAALGEYNIKHALEAIAVGRYCGLSFSQLKEGLKKWQGVKRRFELLYQDQKKMIISDYAHHPSELKAVADNLEGMETDKKKVIIFQPHQYLRTKELFDDYDKILDHNLDERVIFKIYKVREKVEEKELEELGYHLSEKISNKSVHYYNHWGELKTWLINYSKNHEAIYLFLGAGSIDELVRNWVRELE